MTPPPARAAAALLVAVAALLGGCVGSVGASNFTITPDRIGWNTGEEASFTLALAPSLTRKSPEYAVDADFAIAEVSLNERGVGFGGDFHTRDATEIGLTLHRNGTVVEEALLAPGNESVTLRFTVPDDLNDGEYGLELKLFRVGWVRSAPFRVNVP